MKFLFLFIFLGILFSSKAISESDDSSSTPESVETESENESEIKNEFPEIKLSARIDTLYNSNHVLTQGFSIPSLRLSALGALYQNLNFRLSAAQSREYTSVLLPQLIPTEAFVEWGNHKESLFRFRGGMFNPSFSPSWTPDLADLPLPDFHETHKRILLKFDTGTELTLRPFREIFELTVGFFNGNGILALNTNDSKAVTSAASLNIPINGVTLSLGGSAYLLNQSNPGRGNFKSNWVTDAFVKIDSKSFFFSAEAFSGRFEDNTRIAYVNGGAGHLKVHFFGPVYLYARLESLDQDPLSFIPLTHYDFGTILQWDPRFTAFLLYDTLLLGSASRANSINIRFRAAL